MHGCTHAHMQADLNVEHPVDPFVLLLSRKPSLTQKQKDFLRILVQHFHLFQVPISTQHAVVMANADLEHLAQIHGLQGECVHLTNQKQSLSAANQRAGYTTVEMFVVSNNFIQQRCIKKWWSVKTFMVLKKIYIFNIDNNKKCFLSSKSTYYNDFRRIMWLK